MVSPYLRVSAVSAARRSETAASRFGSVSTEAAYDATSAAQVRQDVAELGHPVGQRGGLGVVVAHALEGGPGAGHGTERIGLVAVPGQRGTGGLGGQPQRVGVAEPRLLRRQLGVLARRG